MKKRMIAVTVAVSMGLWLGCLQIAAAQTTSDTAAKDDFETLLLSDEPKADSPQQSSTGAEPTNSEATAAEPDRSDTAPVQQSEAAPQGSEQPVPHDDTVPVLQREPAPAPAPQTQPRSKPLEEIIVTAQRREESAQNVPISITVFDQKQLSNANVTSATDLTSYTPSLTANTRFGSDNSTFAVRGFTQDLRTTASVGVYFAEVIAPRGQYIQASGDGAGPGEFFDLQNVQVLKAPQGTLFGRNTTGGAVLIVPNRPSDEFEGYVELSGGDFAARREQAVINVPVTDGFKLRLGIDHNERDGYLNNIIGVGAAELADTNYTAARLSLLLNITDHLENYSILSDTNSNNHGIAGRLFACNPNSDPMANPFFAFVGQQCQAQLANQAASGRDGYYDLLSTIATPISAIKSKRAINTTQWDVTEALTIKNIVAYAHLFTKNGQDVFGTQFRSANDPDPAREFKIGISALNPDVPVTSQETWVEELQVQGRSLEGRLQWQVGAYYERSRPDGLSGSNAAAFISCEMATVEGDPSGYNCFDPTNGGLGSVLNFKVKTDYYNRAVYAQTTFDILDQLSVTGGVRYTWDRTKGYGELTRHAFSGSAPQPPTTRVSSPVVSSQAPTGLAELSYRPFDDVMAYAKYIRGYRQGSVNVASPAGVDTFEPEYVNTYEVGSKTSFGGPIPGRFNFAVFYNDFTNQQLQAGFISPSSGPTTAIFNAGKSRIGGAEVEVNFWLLESLKLSLAYSHLATKLLKQEDHQAEVLAADGPIAGETYTPIANVGDELPYAPDNTYVASLSYRLPLPVQIGTIDLGTTYSSIGKQRASASGSSPFAVLDPYSLLNLNLSWAGIFTQPLDLSVFATNVLDEQYVTFLGGTYNVLGFESRNAGVPLMIGARLKYSFGDAAH